MITSTAHRQALINCRDHNDQIAYSLASATAEFYGLLQRFLDDYGPSLQWTESGVDLGEFLNWLVDQGVSGMQQPEV
jgi:hypothetical protein